jgi:glycosyltransferase involved in cell wall biosynthesis
MGKGPQTGVDRVEQAYLTEILSQNAPAFGLVRSAFGFLLLDRAGLSAVRHGLVDRSRADLASRIAWRKDPARGRTETALRRLAVARCLRRNLMGMLKHHLPHCYVYLNVGHSNLDAHTLHSIGQSGGRKVILVHDTIPLDHPELCRSDTLAGFAQKMRSVARYADLVIFSTHDARKKAEAHFLRFGRAPKAVVAKLGVTLAEPTPLSFTPQPPYFVCLGTIEPRKNHATLLDVWQRLGTAAPLLYIVGARGWASDALFTRLDAAEAEGRVKILSGLTDGQVTTLLQSAQGLLFPSLAEGFGIPAIEAASLGTPVILSNLPVFKEILPHSAVYLEPEDSYSWLETIARLAAQKKNDTIAMTPPSWGEHFNEVFTALS